MEFETAGVQQPPHLQENVRNKVKIPSSVIKFTAFHQTYPIRHAKIENKISCDPESPHIGFIHHFGRLYQVKFDAG